LKRKARDDTLKPEDTQIYNFRATWEAADRYVTNVLNAKGVQWVKKGNKGIYDLKKEFGKRADWFDVALIGQVVTHCLKYPGSYEKYSITIDIDREQANAFEVLRARCPTAGNASPLEDGKFRANASGIGRRNEPFPIVNAQPNSDTDDLSQLPDFDAQDLQSGATVAIHVQLSTYSIVNRFDRSDQDPNTGISAKLQEVFVLDADTILPTPKRRRRNINDD
jgi:hypothetical protein